MLVGSIAADYQHIFDHGSNTMSAPKILGMVLIFAVFLCHHLQKAQETQNLRGEEFGGMPGSPKVAK